MIMLHSNVLIFAFLLREWLCVVGSFILGSQDATILSFHQFNARPPATQSSERQKRTPHASEENIVLHEARRFSAMSVGACFAISKVLSSIYMAIFTFQDQVQVVRIMCGANHVKRSWHCSILFSREREQFKDRIPRQRPPRTSFLVGAGICWHPPLVRRPARVLGAAEVLGAALDHARGDDCVEEQCGVRQRIPCLIPLPPPLIDCGIL